MRDLDFFTKRGSELLKTGDLFAEPDTIVIPIKTKGRTYGILSRTVAERGIIIPDLAVGCTTFMPREAKPNIVFVAFWEDEDRLQNTERFRVHVSDCVGACINTARQNNVSRLAFPLLGGNRGVEGLPAMAVSIDHEIDRYEIIGGPDMPDVVILTDREV